MSLKAIICEMKHKDKIYTMQTEIKECLNLKKPFQVQHTGCPTRYRNRHFFNNFTTGWRTAAPYRNNQAHYRHTLQTHFPSFLTQRTYSCSNFVAISSMPVSVASGTLCIMSFLFGVSIQTFTLFSSSLCGVSRTIKI